MIAKFVAAYPTLLRGLVGINDVLLTTAKTIINSFGVPIVLVLLLIVEQQRVVHGMMLLEADTNLAHFAAWSLVLLNLVLEFQIHYIEAEAGWKTETEYRWSMQVWARRMLYALGRGNPIAKSPAARYIKVLGLVTFSILALALVGSMLPIISQYTVPWHQAIRLILTESTLRDMLIWVGGIVFTLAAVYAAQSLCRYIAIRSDQIIKQMEAIPTPTPLVQTGATSSISHPQPRASEPAAPAPARNSKSVAAAVNGTKQHASTNGSVRTTVE